MTLQAMSRAEKRVSTSPSASGRTLSTKPKLGKDVSQRSSGTPCGRGMASTSMVAPTFEHSSSISAVPMAPAMLMSFAASHRSASASVGSTSRSARRRAPGAVVEAFQ